MPEIYSNEKDKTIDVIIPKGWSCQVVVKEPGTALACRGASDDNGALLAGYMQHIVAVPEQPPDARGEAILASLRAGIRRG